MIVQVSSTMAVQPDIVVETPDRRRVLVVECKRAKETSPSQAARWRRNYLVHGLDSGVPYFLLAFSTALFLWRENHDMNAEPDFTAPAKSILQRYLGAAIADRPGGPLEESLEIAFSTWLSDLANGIREPDVSSEADQMLVQSGLFAQIKDGVVRTQVVQ
jgi:hypothetical protein